MAHNEIHFRRIGWRQTLDVIKLSRSLLPEELCRKTHSLFALFVNLERKNQNLSFGLYSGNELVGYMLVYFHDRSLYHQRDERIVHIDEYCVKSDYRGRGRDVISRMVHEMDLWQPKSGIEAIATGDALQHWLSIGRLVARWGYETHLRENDCVRAGHQMGRIRWEFKPDEYWRPISPQKPPKPILSKEVSGRNIELLAIKSTRQWLSLKEAYAALDPIGTPTIGSEFGYQWEYWRHFGISEQLSVLVLKEDDNVRMILPLATLANTEDKPRKQLELIGHKSVYPSAQALIDSSRQEYALGIMQECLDQLGIAVAINEILAPRPTTNAKPAHRPWFGLNRRKTELHANFERKIKIDS